MELAVQAKTEIKHLQEKNKLSISKELESSQHPEHFSIYSHHQHQTP